jgi:hypothetical protein
MEKDKEAAADRKIADAKKKVFRNVEGIAHRHVLLQMSSSRYEAYLLNPFLYIHGWRRLMSAGTDSSMQQSAKDKNTGAWSHQKDRKDKRDKRKEAKARKRAYNEQQANGKIVNRFLPISI